MSSRGVYAARHHYGTDETEPLPARHADGYTQSKVEAEQLAMRYYRDFGVPVVILRPGHETFQPAALIMLFGALLFATAAIATKKLITTETTFSIMLWMNLMQLPLNFLGSDPAFILKIDTSLTLPLIGIASAGLASS